MSEQQENEANELTERQRGLETVFGPADPLHLHGVIPFAFGFEMGGTADALSFSSFSTDGILYVSCELVGSPNQPRNADGQYELAICAPGSEPWALDAMLRLCHYTLDSPLNHGDTMDIGPAVPRGSPIAAFVFRKIGSYVAFGRPANVICCVGITKRELKLARRHGSEALFELMPPGFTLTTSDRVEFAPRGLLGWLGA